MNSASASPSDLQAARKALLAEHRRGGVAPEFLRRLGEALTGPLERSAENAELLMVYAQRCWVADQRKPDATRARDAAQRLIEMAPDLSEGYRLLGFAALTRREYRDAFLAFSAVKTLATPANFDNFRALARLLMSDVRKVGFDLDGQHYAFDLTTHNAAAIESSAFHSIGLLTEWEELQFLANLLEPTKIRRIAEVGVLLGNHSAFFLKAFRPEHVTLIDADPANIPFIQSTVTYNSALRAEIHNAFVGDQDGEVTFAGSKVPMRPLSALIDGRVDFLKIDVDGGEEKVLKGAAAVIESSRPTVMIETTPATHQPVLEWFTARGYAERQVFDRGDYRNVVLTP